MTETVAPRGPHAIDHALAPLAALGLPAAGTRGFGADLGAAKFIDNKCRKAGFRPAAAVIVATVRAIKYHGGVQVADLGRENLGALQAGIANLDRHIDNVRDVFGLPCLVAINHRVEDSAAELGWLMDRATHHGVKVIVARHYAEGGAGALEVAREVVELCGHANYFKYVYEESATLWDKMKAVATRIYGASEITADSKVRAQIRQLQESGYGHYPVCVAKTQYSFSTDPQLRGAPHGHVVNIREVRLAAGAEFVVMICGEIMTMPGLPAVPAANSIDVDDDGRITGLF
jgi:formate--tetrahydrofolate ligase